MRDLSGKLIKKDIFGRKIPKKQLKREVLEENVRKGKVGEILTEAQLSLTGRVERTGRGSDYKHTTVDPWTGRRKTKYIEVKTGKSRVRPLQRKTKKRMGSRYKVVRRNGLVL